MTYNTSPTETDFTLKVIFVEALGEPTPLIVIVSPSAWPEPPFVIVIVGVDEPSVTILAVNPVPEPVVPDWPVSNVPGVPPVPPAILSISITSPLVNCDTP